MISSWLRVCIGLAVLGSVPLAAQPNAVGGEFQVNTYTSSYQSGPAVAVGASGDFVVVWGSYESGATDTSAYSVQGQRFTSDGSAVGGEFQVNTYTPNSQRIANVAVGPTGDFVVVWYSYGSADTDSDEGSIQGQRFTSDGSAVGGEFQINTYTSNDQFGAVAAVGATGDFVVVWDSVGSGGTDSSENSIQGQRYTSDGSAVGGEFQVNTYTTSYQSRPAVAVDAAGDFVVVWASYNWGGADSSKFSVLGQRYTSDGSVVGGEFQVNTYTTSDQQWPAVAVSATGDFVVVWESYGSAGTDTSAFSVQGQRFTSDGSAVGGEFQVNTYTPNSQRKTAVAWDSTGDFVVVWDNYGSNGTDSSYSSVQGQRYASDGSAVGGQFQVNTFTTNKQEYPTIAAAATGHFVVVWHSYGSAGTDSSSYSVQGQVYLLPFFEDGFESGDTSAWQ